ncbi:glycerate kinase family protein [Vallitalea okinawensis]|uniref:glycerate kinase family protein n=1 Tax=Vallitalea okinawensis TaxID=2078660 RepID=UPI000CFE1F77|nr:glycerate kinase [Vallitalea okinawensis]
MNIVIAPDSFKGSISAEGFCNIVEKTILELDKDATVHKVPLADGGEGTVEALTYNTGGKIKEATVTGPSGKTVVAQYGILGNESTAVIEMASASGLPLVPQAERNPLITTTYGTGELIKTVIAEGCQEIILGIGGSATNDGGAGMLQALGFNLLDDQGEDIPWGAKGIAKLASIKKDQVAKEVTAIKIIVACDVNNPLCGPNGASFVYGPQKGAKHDEVIWMDQALRHYADIIQTDLGLMIADTPGAGAAGGLGAGLMAFLGAELRPGFDIIQAHSGLEEILRNEKVDLVITGEGEMNHQTINGKLPAGVSALAKKYGVPCIAFVGNIGDGAEMVYDCGLTSIFSIVPGPRTLDQAMANADSYLYETAQRVLKLWMIGKDELK